MKINKKLYFLKFTRVKVKVLLKEEATAALKVLFQLFNTVPNAFTHTHTKISLNMANLL